MLGVLWRQISVRCFHDGDGYAVCAQSRLLAATGEFDALPSEALRRVVRRKCFESGRDKIISHGLADVYL